MSATPRGRLRSLPSVAKGIRQFEVFTLLRKGDRVPSRPRLARHSTRPFEVSTLRRKGERVPSLVRVRGSIPPAKGTAFLHSLAPRAQPVARSRRSQRFACSQGPGARAHSSGPAACPPSHRGSAIARARRAPGDRFGVRSCPSAFGSDRFLRPRARGARRLELGGRRFTPVKGPSRGTLSLSHGPRPRSTGPPACLATDPPFVL